MQINASTIEWASRKGVTLHELIFLYYKHFAQEWNEEVFPVVKNDLLLKGLINEEGDVTLEGKEVVQGCLQQSKVSITSTKEFEDWWNSYPISDEHGYFPMTRPLRVKKEECRIVFSQILKKGVTLQDLLNAIDKEVTGRRARSIDRNEMTFMPNSLNYLQGEYFTPWIEENKKPTTSNDRFKLI